MKGKDYVISKADHPSKFTFTSHQNKYLDLPAAFISHASLQGALDINSLEEWYNNDLVVLPIKNDYMDLPVFCKSSNNG